MKLLRFIISWQFWVSAILALAILAALAFSVDSWLDFYTNHGKTVKIPDLKKMSIQQAIKSLDDAGLNYEIDSFKYDPEYKPFKIVDFYPAAGERVKKGRRIFIKSNPKTYPPVALPNILNRTKGLAFMQLTNAGLVVQDTIYEMNIAKDAVLRILYGGKIITPGTLLPRFSKVDLVLGQGVLKDVIVPSFVGMSYQEAKSLIESSFFSLGKLNFQGSSNDTLNAKIFYQSPLPLDHYDQGLPIDLWVSGQPIDSMKIYVDELNKIYTFSAKDDSLRMVKAGSPRGQLSEEIRAQLKENPNQAKGEIKSKIKLKPKKSKKIESSAPPEGVSVE